MADALSLYENYDVVVVDIRDIRELYRDGKILGGYHAPRGERQVTAIEAVEKK
ncbi:MAG: hypothetical protein ABGX28_06630 [Methylococcales bacterium]